MAEGALTDRLDRAVDAILARADATAALSDPELAPLAVLAAELRHYPSPEFRVRLATTLHRRIAMSLALASTDLREGFTTLTPYLHAPDGRLVEFLVRTFGAVETHRSQGGAGGVHREVRVGDSMLMVGEPGSGATLPLRPTAFHIYVEDVDAAFERALAAGGESMGAPEDRPYGERSGFVKDMCGNRWYIATHLGGSAVPKGFRTITPFLHPEGVAAYIAFLEQAFGAVEEFRHEAGGVVMHARVQIGTGAVEMGDTQGTAEPMPTNFYLYVGDADALYQRAVAAGARSLAAPALQSYGDRVGSVEDAMGNVWYIAQPA